MTILTIAVRPDDRDEVMLPIEFGKGGFERVVAVGSDPGCHVRLRGEGVRPVHAYLAAASNHRFVEFLHADDGREPYEVVRVDGYDFPIGRFRLRFCSERSTEAPATAEARSRWRWTGLFDRLLSRRAAPGSNLETRGSQVGGVPIDDAVERGAHEPTLHPRGAMGRSCRIEIRLNDVFRSELESQSRSDRSTSAYASSCLAIESSQRSAQAWREAAEDCHGPHAFELFASRHLVAHIDKRRVPPQSIEEIATRLVATRLARRRRDAPRISSAQGGGA